MPISQINSNSLASGVPARSNMPAGSVLQVVNATFSTPVTSTSSTRTDLGLSASITPSSASNKILAIVSLADIGKFGGSGSGPYVRAWLMRDSTDIVRIVGQGSYTGDVSSNSVASASASYLDSPATTSSITYKVQWQNAPAVGTVEINASSSSSTLTLMEIVA